MRKRALTIYAENEENFVEVNFYLSYFNHKQFNNLEATEKIRVDARKPKSKSKSKLTEIIEEGPSNLKIKENDKKSTERFAFAEENLDFLSQKENFKLQLKELTSRELEEMDEKKLMNSLNIMNNSFKNKNKAEFMKALSDLCPNSQVLKSLCEMTNCFPFEASNLDKPEEAKSYKSKRTYTSSIDSYEANGLETNYVKHFSKNSNFGSLVKNSSKVLLINNNDFTENIPETFNDLSISTTNTYKIESKYSHKTHLSSMSTYNTETTSPKTITNNNLENIISQNLNLAEDMIKLITIGEKGVGKSFFIEKVLSNDTEQSPILIGTEKYPCSFQYKPTVCLEIKRTFINLMDKIVKLEIWDTNVNIINNSIIKTYYKLCNGIVLVCDVGSIESIKFIEKQLDYILASINNSNIFILANIRNEIDVNEVHANLNYLSYIAEKFMIKPSFVNLSEYDFQKDVAIQKFIKNCLIKKVNGQTGIKKNHLSASTDTGEKIEKKEFPGENISKEGLPAVQNIIFKPLENKIINERDVSASPQSFKREMCTIF